MIVYVVTQHVAYESGVAIGVAFSIEGAKAVAQADTIVVLEWSDRGDYFDTDGEFWYEIRPFEVQS